LTFGYAMRIHLRNRGQGEDNSHWLGLLLVISPVYIRRTSGFVPWPLRLPAPR